ncbi:hypothetical protein MTO96_052304 [Rhipicephalus appendiculatus]
MGRPPGDVWVARRQSMPFLMANAQCLECCVDLLAYPIAPVSPGARKPDGEVGFSACPGVFRTISRCRRFLFFECRRRPFKGGRGNDRRELQRQWRRRKGLNKRRPPAPMP